MTTEPDLFGAGKPVQLSLFGDGAARLQPSAQAFVPDPDDVRRRLQLVLHKARTAETMPWPERELRMWQTVFPNMANWLPAPEAEQLRFDFSREIERLKAA